jgi:Repeat of unknown function (DUF5648)
MKKTYSFPEFLAKVSLSRRLSISVRRLTLLAAAALVALLPTAIAPAEGATQKPAALTAAFYRLYNQTTGDQFYTINPNDPAFRLDSGYVYERIAAIVADGPGDNLVPFHQLYNGDTGDHFYTIDQNEVDYAVQFAGYVYEKVAAYVRPVDAGSPRFYRAYNETTGDHFYTTDQNEYNNAVQHLGYLPEGVRCRVVAEAP